MPTRFSPPKLSEARKQELVSAFKSVEIEEERAPRRKAEIARELWMSLGASETALLLGISRATVYRLAENAEPA